MDKLRCSASELLGLYSLLRCYVDMKARDRPELRANFLSFDACCDQLAFILAVKKKEFRTIDAAPSLEEKISRFMRLHVACYGDAKKWRETGNLAFIPAARTTTAIMGKRMGLDRRG